MLDWRYYACDTCMSSFRDDARGDFLALNWATEEAGGIIRCHCGGVFVEVPDPAEDAV